MTVGLLRGPYLAFAVALALGGCGRAEQENGRSTVRMKLPEARSAAPKPGFSNGSAPSSMRGLDTDSKALRS